MKLRLCSAILNVSNVNFRIPVESVSRKTFIGVNIL